jgi:hypothetical protein
MTTQLDTARAVLLLCCQETFELPLAGKVAEVDKTLAEPLAQFYTEVRTARNIEPLMASGYLTYVKALDAHKPLVYNRCWLESACSYGHAAVVKWLAGRFKLKAEFESEYARVLACACAGGHLVLAQWLVRRFGLNAVRDGHGNGSALWGSCSRGHLEVAQWLTATFDLTARDVESTRGDIFVSICMQDNTANQLGVAKWFAKHFKLTREDVLAENADAVRECCKRGHTALLQWIVAHFAFKIKDVRTTNAFAECCSGGHVELAQWLMRRFSLKRADVLARDGLAFSIACVHGHLSVAQ